MVIIMHYQVLAVTPLLFSLVRTCTVIAIKIYNVLFTDAFIFAAFVCPGLEGSHQCLLVFFVSFKRSDIVSFYITVKDSSNITRNSTTFDMPAAGNYSTIQVKFDRIRTSDDGMYSYTIVATDNKNDTAIVKGTFNFFTGISIQL